MAVIMKVFECSNEGVYLCQNRKQEEETESPICPHCHGYHQNDLDSARR